MLRSLFSGEEMPDESYVTTANPYDDDASNTVSYDDDETVSEMTDVPLDH